MNTKIVLGIHLAVMASLIGFAILFPAQFTALLKHPDLYLHAKFTHVFCVTLFFANVVIGTIWETRSLVNGQADIIRYTYQTVAWLDAVFTAPLIIVSLVSGLILVTILGGVWSMGWVALAFCLFVLSGIFWVVADIPTQYRLNKLLGATDPKSPTLPPAVTHLLWYRLLINITAILILIVVFALMIYKPTLPNRLQQLLLTEAAPQYPKSWWAPVPATGAPDWEILPQAARPGEVILSKRNELGLLSNFAATPFTFRGQRYASLEGFWQSLLYPESPTDPRATFPGLVWKYTRDQVAQLTAFDAKAAGDLAFSNLKKMGINWVTFQGKRMDYWTAEKGPHYRLIVEATHEKVSQNSNVRNVLLATHGLILRPDHHQEKNAPPAWHYFDILTDIRDELVSKPVEAALPRP
jgi:uncharacterized membrane protein/predicted NAD-dependent protein-ADP-ribosyltransferase YbiA (DUF1768 family)